MVGYQLTFFTQQDKQHGHTPLSEWLVAEARRLGIGGATVTLAAEGFGNHGKLHSAHFFELADQPLEVVMVATEEEADSLFSALRAESVDLFYLRSPVEFGHVSDS